MKKREAVKIAEDIEPNISEKDRLKWAKIGINALIDEATGYQNTRPNDALRKMKIDLDDVDKRSAEAIRNTPLVLEEK